MKTDPERNSLSPVQVALAMADAAEAKFRGLLESAPDAMIVVDRSGRIVLVNSQAEAMFGYKREELLAQEVEILLPERFRHIHLLHRATYFGEPKTRPMGAGWELMARRRDGSEIPVEISLSPLQTEEGTLVTSAIRDISARRRDEMKFQGLLEAAPDAIVIVDQSGRIFLVNSQTEKLFGYTRDEILGKLVETLMPDRFRERHIGHRAQYSAEARVRPMGAGLDLYALRKDGSEFPVEISLSPLRTEQGTLVISVIRDITERKRVEDTLQRAHHELERRVEERTAQLLKANAEKERVREQLFQAEKLAEIGQLAAGVAHEIRNPLAGIRGAIEVLRENSMGPEAQRPIMNEILQRVDRLNGAVRDLLEYAKPMVAFKVPVRVGEVLESVVTSLTRDPRLCQLQIKKNFSNDDTISADPNLLERIFINIILNAAQAMQFAGILTLSVTKTAELMSVSFEDNGPGMHEHIIDRIFIPFFTTRSEGSGLGLALCKKYVELHGGRIEIKTELGKGTTFTILLPSGASAS